MVARGIALYLVAIAALYAAESWLLVLPLWLFTGLAVAGMFVLGHDAAHGVLVDHDRLNYWLAKGLLLPSLHNLELWRLGHNRVHHGHTVCETMDFVWHPVTREGYTAMGRFARMRHRLEWSCLGAGAYYLRVVWWSRMVRPGTLPSKWSHRIRRDRTQLGGAMLAVAAAVAFVGGQDSRGVGGAAWLVIKLLVIPFLVFIWSIGCTVYLHHIGPGIKWHGRRRWSKVAGQMDGTTVLRANPVIDFLFLHSIFVHTPHHVDARIPCYHLDQAAGAIATAFPGRVIDRPLRLADYLRSTKRCKLMDFETGRWLSYSAAAGRA